MSQFAESGDQGSAHDHERIFAGAHVGYADVKNAPNLAGSGRFPHRETAADTPVNYSRHPERARNPPIATPDKAIAAPTTALTITVRASVPPAAAHRPEEPLAP
ncbi:hypothetical protein GCM10020255_037730 [Rhodococcus baikonurensis]